MTDQPIADDETAQCWRNDPHQPHMWTWRPEDGGVDCPGIATPAPAEARTEVGEVGPTPAGTVDNPDGLQDRIAAALAEEFTSPGRNDLPVAERLDQGMMRVFTADDGYPAMAPVTPHQAADAVLAVPAIQQLQTEIGRLEIANRALNQAALEAIERAEKAEAALERVRAIPRLPHSSQQTGELGRAYTRGWESVINAIDTAVGQPQEHLNRAESHAAAVEQIHTAAGGLYATTGLRVLAALDPQEPS